MRFRLDVGAQCTIQCVVDVNLGQKGEQEDRRNTTLNGDPMIGLIILSTTNQ